MSSHCDVSFRDRSLTSPNSVSSLSCSLYVVDLVLSQINRNSGERLPTSATDVWDCWSLPPFILWASAPRLRRDVCEALVFHEQSSDAAAQTRQLLARRPKRSPSFVRAGYHPGAGLQLQRRRRLRCQWRVYPWLLGDGGVLADSVRWLTPFVKAAISIHSGMAKIKLSHFDIWTAWLLFTI